VGGGLFISDGFGLVLAGVSLGGGLLVIGAHQFVVGSDRLLFVKGGHALLDPRVRDELEEGVGGDGRGANDDADTELSHSDLAGGFEDGSAEEGEARGKLNTSDDEDDEQGEEVAGEHLETVKLLLADVTAVDEVEDLEEDEGVPDKGEVSHLVSAFISLFNGHGRELVVLVEHSLSTEADNDQHAEHIETDADDLAVHLGSHKTSLSTVLGVGNVGLGASSGKGEGSKNIHDEVDVDELDGVEARLSHSDVREHNNSENSQVAGNLELEESLDVHVDVATPHNSAHA